MAPAETPLEQATRELNSVVMAATPSVWKTTTTPDSTEVITVLSDPNADAPEQPECPPPQPWIEMRFDQVTGTGPIPEIFVSPTTTNLSEEAMNLGGCVEILDPEGRAVAFVRASLDFIEPTIGPEEMESSCELRANDDQDDTMGQQFDHSMEIGDAEEWFRDKLRVR